MVEALLAHEAEIKKQLETYETKKSEFAARKKAALHDKSGNDLKDMCTKKGLAAGVGKEERINRLVEHALQDGEIDVLVKEVMVERVLSHEAEIGEPLSKKARK